jgi:hypothetical protein
MNRLVRTVMALALPLCMTSSLTETTVRAAQPAGVTGVVHESRPTEDKRLAEVRVQVRGGPPAGSQVTTDAQGRFQLPFAPPTGAVLEVTKEGYEPITVTVHDATVIEVAMTPAAREISIIRSGANDCSDLPAPPSGVPGVREYARFPVHHDGSLVVTAAKLPFASNPGFLYRQTAAGWVKNEIDYVLLRQPLPVLGGFWYVLTFGEGMDNCGSWSIDATHPS